MNSATRVYVPVTRALLVELVSAGRFAGPREAHAVTPTLRAAWPEANEEELEYAALCAAAGSSLTMRALDESARRFVLAADVSLEGSGPSREGEAATSVRVGDVFLGNLAAVHVDLQDLTDPDDDLAWFAPQELVNLLRSG